MYADIERENFDPKSHFSRLLHHQGRVLLASDLNAHGAISQYYLRQFIIDFVGARWRTKGSFEIKAVEDNNFQISQGHFYIDGILCVNEDAQCWYSPKPNETAQPMFPTPELSDLKSGDLKIGFAVYLECWERHVNLMQRPAIREVALGGPDTSSRLEIAWQIRVLTPALAKNYIDAIASALRNMSKPPAEIAKITNIYKDFNDSVGDADAKKHCAVTQAVLDVLDTANPRLRVWAKRPADETDACSISPDAQFRGVENQLYRVEIHTSGVVVSGSPQPSFKWSRENGSLIFEIIPESLNTTSTEITVDLEALGRDRRYGLCVNDWVELTSDEIEFGQQVLPLAKVIKIDATLGRLTLTTKTKADFSGCSLLRRWDQKEGPINDVGTIDITEANDNEFDKWIPLECGIKIQFQPGGNYKKGDYWLVTARTGDVEWPKTKDTNGNDVPAARPTDGIKRHRAALAAVIAGKPTPSCGCVLDPICTGK